MTDIMEFMQPALDERDQKVRNEAYRKAAEIVGDADGYIWASRTWENDDVKRLLSDICDSIKAEIK